MRCVAYFRDLKADAAVVPLGATAATFSAYGLAGSDVVLSAEVSDPHNFPVPAPAVASGFAQLEADLRRRTDGQRLPFKSVEISREVDIRHTLQLSQVTTPAPAGPVDVAAVETIARTFDELYARLYGPEAGFRDAGLQLVTYRAYATGTLPVSPDLPEAARGTGRPQRRSRMPALVALACGPRSAPPTWPRSG